jgi:hypothetical protein
MKRNRMLRILKFAPLAIVGVAVFGFLFGWVVMSLWNWLMPTLFSLHPITFWQAIGLLFLSRILLGGFRGGRGGHWRHRMKERWETMSPEEREKFREGMRSRWGACGEATPEAKV